MLEVPFLVPLVVQLFLAVFGARLPEHRKLQEIFEKAGIDRATHLRSFRSDKIMGTVDFFFGQS